MRRRGSGSGGASGVLGRGDRGPGAAVVPLVLIVCGGANVGGSTCAGGVELARPRGGITRGVVGAAIGAGGGEYCTGRFAGGPGVGGGGGARGVGTAAGPGGATRDGMSDAGGDGGLRRGGADPGSQDTVRSRVLGCAARRGDGGIGGSGG